MYAKCFLFLVCYLKFEKVCVWNLHTINKQISFSFNDKDTQQTQFNQTGKITKTLLMFCKSMDADITLLGIDLCVRHDDINFITLHIRESKNKVDRFFLQRVNLCKSLYTWHSLKINHLDYNVNYTSRFIL